MLSTLQAQVFSEDTEIVRAAFAELTEIGGEEVFQFYVGLLESTRPLIRNRAACGIIEIGDQRAVQPLLHAILKTENIGANGTLVYALGHFDCNNLFKEICLILFYHGYEARQMAWMIIDDTEFTVALADSLKIRKHWHMLKEDTVRQKQLEKLELEYIEEFLDDYLL
ncbi:HEAT repeat domain-containing protein [Hymenobacter wooponensis]|uniref:HEAT repeat domain-containing protein n=1 Tax=Hymenobacter wooponensis TaxID=1525360 RepID=A0A4Z0MUF7_9BACT|nr:hypothetical protein [Hymenobacter wooponensis]TGD83264.1 hypothetical protein EU557_05650 [Hymenobacter wooponensis]